MKLKGLWIIPYQRVKPYFKFSKEINYTKIIFLPNLLKK